MEGSSASRTSETLLGRLRQDPADPAAWDHFVERYSPKIYGWCCKWGLQDSDACDITQNVLMGLVESLRTFVYDRRGSFRAWLNTVTHHAWRDFVRVERRNGGAGGIVNGLLENAHAREDLVRRLSEEFDRERLETAMARVQLRVELPTWEAFRLQAIEGMSGKHAAQALGLSVSAAYMNRSRVQNMIRQEIARLEKGDPD